MNLLKSCSGGKISRCEKGTWASSGLCPDYLAGGKISALNIAQSALRGSGSPS